MTQTTQYEYSRLEALPEAIKLIEAVRFKVTPQNDAAWQKLYRAGEKLRQQLAAEFTAYFSPEPEPGPAPFAPNWKEITAAHARQEAARTAPVIDVEDALPGLTSLLGYHLPGGNPGARTISPGVDYQPPATKWYNDPATIARCLQQRDAQRIAGTISDHGVNATVTPTPGGAYTVTVAQRDEARANRALALAEQDAK